jgi:hypothetical protein
MNNKYGQNVPLTEEEKNLRGYKRRKLVLIITIFVLIAVIGIQIALMLI